MPKYDASIRMFDVNDGVNKKKCRMCQVFKSASDFYFHPTNSDRLSRFCRICHKVEMQRRYKVNPEPTKRRARNRDAVLRNNPRHRLSRLLERVRQLSNIPCDLTLDYLHGLYNQQEGLCSLTHRVMSLGKGEDGLAEMNAMSIDRWKPGLGYVKGNVCLITIQANIAKNRWSIVDLIEFCNDILKTRQTNPNNWGMLPINVVSCKEVSSITYAPQYSFVSLKDLL